MLVCLACQRFLALLKTLKVSFFCAASSISLTTSLSHFCLSHLGLLLTLCLCLYSLFYAFLGSDVEKLLATLLCVTRSKVASVIHYFPCASLDPKTCFETSCTVFLNTSQLSSSFFSCMRQICWRYHLHIVLVCLVGATSFHLFSVFSHCSFFEKQQTATCQTSKNHTFTTESYNIKSVISLLSSTKPILKQEMSNIYHICSKTVKVFVTQYLLGRPGLACAFLAPLGPYQCAAHSIVNHSTFYYLCLLPSTPFTPGIRSSPLQQNVVISTHCRA